MVTGRGRLVVLGHSRGAARFPRPRHRRGLFDTVEAWSLKSVRATLQAEILHTATTGGRRLRSPTGFGDLPMGDPGVQFLLSRGYALEETARMSFLRLPADAAALEQLFARATDAAGERFSLVYWIRKTPTDRVGLSRSPNYRFPTIGPGPCSNSTRWCWPSSAGIGSAC